MTSRSGAFRWLAATAPKIRAVTLTRLGVKLQSRLTLGYRRGARWAWIALGGVTVAASMVAGVLGPGEDGVYAAHDRIEVRVRFDAPVTVDASGGAPTLGMALGGIRREGRPSVRTGKVGTKAPEPARPYTVPSGESRHGVEPALRPRGNPAPEPAGSGPSIPAC